MPKQNVSVEMFYDGSWHNIAATDDVYAEAPIVIRRGQGDESPAPRPAQVTMQLANDDDTYRTSNPMSPLYGLAGRNTPTRIKVGSATRAVVEASLLACDQTPDFRASPRRGKAWTDFEGGGLLQRIGQWSEPLKSPFRQYNDGLPQVIGYWPAEQQRGSTELIATVLGTAPGRFNQDIAFDSQHRPPGSAPLMDIGDSDNAEVGGYFRVDPAATATDGYQISWVARYEELAPGEQDIFDWETLDGGAYGLYLDSTTGQMLVYALSGTGASLISGAGSTYSGYDWSQWTMFVIDVQYSSGTTTLWITWTNATDTQSGAWTASFSGVPSQPAWWDVSVFAGVPRGSTMGHVIAVSEASTGGVVDLWSADRQRAWTGYLGERAAYRFARLCEQLGVSYYVSTGFASSMPMGPQPVATFAEQLEEIAATEDALISDYRTEARIYLICRVDRYHLAPAVELTPADLPALPREVVDDLPVHNIVTVVQRDGLDATARDDTGPLGTDPPPDGVGEYRQRVDVNVADPDTMLPVLAEWWLALGTVDLPRFPQVRIDLTPLSPTRIAAVEAVDVGSVLTISGFREHVVRLRVLGYVEVIGTHAREIVFTCAPDQQYAAALYDDPAARYGSGSSVIKSAATSTATALTVRTTVAGEVWSTTEEPYDVLVYGERMTVTVMGAASLVSGAYDQAATVTRSTNGVIKSVAALRPVRLADEARYAL